MATILIVDDDPVQRRLLEAMVTRFGHRCETAEGGAEALALLDGPGRIDLVILDLIMPPPDGMAVLAQLRERPAAPPAIVQTANGSLEAVVGAMRAGAADFVVKPVGPERLEVSIANALKAAALEGEIRRVQRRVPGSITARDILTASGAMRAVLSLAERCARTSIPVLVEGESGVGKELVARAIHGGSPRAAKPFITVNCGAIPANLVESVLFGHERGAFTGATERHPGKFIEAHGGTLFLDEIGELPLDAQVKLLRALQDGEFDPVGARRSVRVDVRIVSATNRDLSRLVAAGRFREDLYYRLNVFPITVPPLRQRPEDIGLLARHFLARFSAEEGRRVRAITPDALRILEAHEWPGNVRELENAVFRAVILAESSDLDPAAFPHVLAKLGGEPLAQPCLNTTARPDGAADRPPVFLPVPHALPMVEEDGGVRRLEDLEREVIAFALRHHRGQMSEIARRLGIGRSTLYRKLKELGIDATGLEGPAPTADPDVTAAA